MNVFERRLDSGVVSSCIEHKIESDAIGERLSIIGEIGRVRVDCSNSEVIEEGQAIGRILIDPRDDDVCIQRVDDGGNEDVDRVWSSINTVSPGAAFD